MPQFLLPIFTIFAIWAAVPQDALIAQPIKNPYENIDSFQLFQTLEKPCSQFAQNAPIGSVLRDIAQTHSIAVWIDRRVDIDRSISISTDESASLETVLKRIAADCECEIAYINSIVYFAPKGQAANAENAYWKLFMSSDFAAARQMDSLWSWSEVSNPLELIIKRANLLAIRLEDPQPIEHDLWAPNTIPANNRAAQWTCVLQGFGMALRYDASTKRLSIESAHLAQDAIFDYSPQQLNAVGKEAFNKWKTTWSSSEVKKTKSNFWQIKAPVAAHRELIRLAHASDISKLNSKGAKPKKQTIENSRFTLQLRGPLASALNALKQQAEIEILPWPLPEPLATRQITLNLEKATLDELLQGLAKEATIQITRVGNKVTITK